MRLCWLPLAIPRCGYTSAGHITVMNHPWRCLPLLLLTMFVGEIPRRRSPLKYINHALMFRNIYRYVYASFNSMFLQVGQEKLIIHVHLMRGTWAEIQVNSFDRRGGASGEANTTMISAQKLLKTTEKYGRRTPLYSAVPRERRARTVLYTPKANAVTDEPVTGSKGTPKIKMPPPIVATALSLPPSFPVCVIRHSRHTSYTSVRPSHSSLWTRFSTRKEEGCRHPEPRPFSGGAAREQL